MGEVERKGNKMVMHVLLHTWGNREEERGYKAGKDGWYEILFLRPLREAEKLGVKWDMVQTGLEHVEVEKKRAGQEKGGCCVM